jgi:Flp pilus assembly protein protease CpaA
MQDAAEIRGRKRRSNRAVLVGFSLMAFALLVSSRELAPPLATTVAAIAGFVIVMYGVHVGWLVFYDREPDGPPS